jgi:S1-C subfamily serine protease
MYNGGNQDMRRQFIRIILVLTLVLAALPPLRVVAQGEDWQCAIVNGGDVLNIRSGPGTNYLVVTLVSPGQQLEADFSRQQAGGGFDWVPVRFDSTQGWTITARLEPCPSSGGPASPTPASAPPADAPTPAPVAPVDPLTTNHGPGVTANINADGVLDRVEIEEMARSVVLVANVQKGRVVATGTGTIITPDGLIVTNAHVVEDAELVGVGVLQDINEQPDFLYLGEVVGIDTEIDVALIAIRFDLDNNPVETATLNLPFVPPSLGANEVFRGDPVYIFGYPGIGDDYLVVTTGSIVSVENGELNGVRMPVWYRTDAEIAPGNSGGLVVNGNGQFVGIPTFVRAETQTGGRLGGIRPTEVALMAVAGTSAAVNAPADAMPIEVFFGSVTMEHGAVSDGEPGIQILVTFAIDGWQGRDAVISARFYHDDLQSQPIVNPNAPGKYRDKDNAILTSIWVTPCCERTDYDSLVLFIPYSALGLDQPGTYPLKYRIDVEDTNQTWRRTLSWEFIVLTRG